LLRSERAAFCSATQTGRRQNQNAGLAPFCTATQTGRRQDQNARLAPFCTATQTGRRQNQNALQTLQSWRESRGTSMPKKSTDPFMSGLWNALVADNLGPGGNQTGWAETPVRIRNRFIHAVRQVLQSGAAFEASALEIGRPEKATAKVGVKTAGRAGRKPRGKQHDPRELQLPLMAGVKRERG
jgi:hypothetical protein